MATDPLITLDETGALILDNFMTSDLLRDLRERVAELQAAEGDRAGSEFKFEPGCIRLANLAAKGTIFQKVFADAAVLDQVARVLGTAFKLSSLNCRTALPDAEGQPLHADMGALADERGYWVCNTVWMLDDFTTENGALRYVPGSHRWRRLPQDELADPRAPHPQEVLITGPAGTVVVMNAHVWHGGLPNRTAVPRTALHAFYCRRDKPQQQDQKALLSRELQDSLPAELRHLLALDDPHVENKEVVRSGFLK